MGGSFHPGASSTARLCLFFSAVPWCLVISYAQDPCAGSRWHFVSWTIRWIEETTLCEHCGSETQGVPAIPQQAEFGPYAESISWQQLCLLHGAKGVTVGKGRMREQQSLFSSVLRSVIFQWTLRSSKIQWEKLLHETSCRSMFTPSSKSCLGC